MSTEEPFLELLIKVMGMTTSDNDGQTLVAIRKANAILTKNSTSWDALLRGKVKVIADPFASIDVDNMRRSPAKAPPPPPPKPQYHPDNLTKTYSAPMPRPQRTRPQTPPPPPKAAPQHNPDLRQVNRYDGTCVLCKRKVRAGEGFAVKPSGSTVWHTEHKIGECNRAMQSQKRPAFTTDDL